MFCKFLLASLLTLSFTVGFSAGDVSAGEMRLDYRYGGEHGVNFSEMPRGPLKLGEFRDGRAGVDSHTIRTDSGVGQKSATALPELVRAALHEGFLAGGAGLVESGEKLVLNGELTEFSSKSTNGEVQVTVRAKVKLSNSSGNQMFSTTIFGRGSTPENEGLTAAVSASLDELVNALMWDDYFLMQVID